MGTSPRNMNGEDSANGISVTTEEFEEEHNSSNNSNPSEKPEANPKSSFTSTARHLPFSSSVTSNKRHSSTNIEALMAMSDESHSEIEEDNFLAGGDDKKKNQNEALQEVKKATKRELRNIRVWKFLFLLLALATAAVVSAGTYIILQAEEDDDYEESYDLFVSAMRDAVRVHVEHIGWSFENMANAMSSDAKAQGATFPFYTMRNFEAIGEGVRRFSRSEVFAWLPFVEQDLVPRWLDYSRDNQNWLDTSREWALNSPDSNAVNTDYLDTLSISPFIYDLGGSGYQATQGPPPYQPGWQTSPPVFNPLTINLDFQYFRFAKNTAAILEQTRHQYFSSMLVPGEIGQLATLVFDADAHENFHSRFGDWNDDEFNSFELPHSAFYQPVFETGYDPTSKLVGYLAANIPWDVYVTNLLPEGISGLVAVIQNSCNDTVTYRLVGNQAEFIGYGDFHDTSYDSTERVIPFSFEDEKAVNDTTLEGACTYMFHIYSSDEFEDQYRSNTALVLTIVVASAFVFLIASYFMYDWFVNKRNQKVVKLAAKSGEIVSSLFPSNIRERLYEEKEESTHPEKQPFSSQSQAVKALTRGGSVASLVESRGGTLSEMMGYDATERSDMDDEGFMYKSQPIADLYPDTTVMFADIAGFTSWSSTRDPTQVFTLLETIYKAFDTRAKRRRVFKVETIGDCYVAVAGLPDPMKDHAVVMCRFAKDCLYKMRELTRRLEMVLGPETSDLEIRIGLHSGSVTAGVLRGEKSRFQLFGDTMNTASRMESTGEKGRIQVSQETADLLTVSGKGHWVKPRDDKVFAKGKGEMQTYWMVTSRSPTSDKNTVDTTTDLSSNENSNMNLDFSSSNFDDSGHDELDFDEKESLVKWNVDMLSGLLKKIVMQNEGQEDMIDRSKEASARYVPALKTWKASIIFPSVEILDVQPLDDTDNVISGDVMAQLQSFVSDIASMDHDRPYHNFTHASHTALSVVRLLSQLDPESESGVAKLLTLDSRALFGCLLAALVKDVVHPGVPNFVLRQEGGMLTQIYGEKCISQQMAIDTIWRMLMGPGYMELRKAIYKTEEEKRHFRDVFVHCIMATELFEKDLVEERKKLWQGAFEDGPQSRKWSAKAKLDHQATLILEHIIQASDTIHTMQHWNVYRKWSTLLLEEVQLCHASGRISKDPAEKWFQGELSLFDDFVLPLVDRLLSSKAFKSGTIKEYSGYASSNRIQWLTHGGLDVVSQMEDSTRNLGREGSTRSLHESMSSAQDSGGLEFWAMMVDQGISENSKEDLLQWNVDLLGDLLAKVAKQIAGKEDKINRPAEARQRYKGAIKEMKEAIDFPSLETLKEQKDAKDEEVSPEALEQLQLFISAMASMDHERPYHNFGHSSHVTQSVLKMLLQLDTTQKGNAGLAAKVLALDYRAQFACLLAAMVKDVVHPGVPNFVLVNEGGMLIQIYGEKCVSQQMSVDTVWRMLVGPGFPDLRKAIYRTEEEKQHFRQVFVQCMLATDLFEPDLVESRKIRWEKAFGAGAGSSPDKAIVDLQATVLLESIIQASDTVHTMQEWDTYRKWSGHLLQEVYQFHKTGRIAKDPSESWFAGELAVFDDFVLPLTGRLIGCGAFQEGTIKEYAEHAVSNRSKWQEIGEDIIAELFP